MAQSDLKSLIAQIDSVLAQPIKSALEAKQSHQVLKKVRNYIISLERRLTSIETEAANRIAQAAIDQINHISFNNAEVSSDLEDLEQQRLILQQQVTKLEEQRQQVMTECLPLLLVLCLQDLENRVVFRTNSLRQKEPESQEMSTIQSLTDLIVPKWREAVKKDAIWYLGVDFGTTGLAAVLADAKTGEQYPIYWLEPHSEQKIWRQPTAVYFSQNSAPVVGVTARTQEKRSGIGLENFKPYLNLGVACLQPQQQIQQAIVALLASLSPDHAETELKVRASGLAPQSWQNAMRQLEGVIFSCPNGWSDPYQFNLREAVLQAKLVSKPEKVFFVEEAIAAFLAHRLDFEAATETTLVINIGAATTELALVNSPHQEESLAYEEFQLHSWAYGGIALEQDIFYQLIYPQWQSQLPAFLCIDSQLPQPGQWDLQPRSHLSSRLFSYHSGRLLFQVAQLAWFNLQEHEQITAHLGNQRWSITQQELEQAVIRPFLAGLKQQLSMLLEQREKSPQAIRQILCSGGAAIGMRRSLRGWLEQQFPQAQIKFTEATTTVAKGLTLLPQFPAVLHRSLHQYSDYFLLKELLVTVSGQQNRSIDSKETDNYQEPRSLSMGVSLDYEQLQKLLQSRGINTNACKDRIQGFLTGKLSTGLINQSLQWGSNDLSHTTNLMILPDVALQILECHQTFSLFRQEKQFYYPESEQLQLLQQFLARMLQHTQQKLEEPLLIKLSVRPT